jgi:PilZ domain
VRPRYTFLALVELTDTVGVMCIEGRMREISSKGCYVNTPSTFPPSTPLKVVISRDEETFTSNGEVVYVHEGIGMGLVFVDATTDQVETLHSWLAGLAGTELL